MPIYQYKCVNCEHEFEQRQRMSDRPLEECPVCEGPVRRVVKSVGIVFKGSGFYVTDNRNGSSPGSNGSGKSASEKKEKEDSKPAAVSENGGTSTEKKVTEATT